MVIYLDVLFGANALMDGVTLLAAARLAGAAVHRGRFVLACLLGGAYAVLAALFPALGALLQFLVRYIDTLPVTK